MKKIIALTLVLMVLHIPNTNVLADTEVWDIYITEINKKSELVTDEAVTLYTGDIQNITHTDTADEGNTYLLVKLYTNKTKTDNSVFNIAGASLTVGSQTIDQLDNGFLSKHNMTPFTKNDIRFGESEGWIVFEVEESLDTTYATLIINGTNVNLEVRKVEADTTLTNIATTENIMDTQWEIEKQLIADYNLGSYDLQNPYVILDPYNWAPLSALALFESEKPARVSVEVQGKDEYSTITHDFDEFNTFHQVPIVGLYADYVNTVTLTLTYMNNSTESAVVEIETEVLVDDFNLLEVRVIESKPELMQEGLTFHEECMGIDCNGDIRWRLNYSNTEIFRMLSNGHFIVLDERVTHYRNGFYEIDFLGKIHAQYSDLIGIHHDVYEMPNGNFLTTSDHDVYIEDRILELDKATGEVVNDMDFKDILDTFRFNSTDNKDWAHMNAFVYDESDSTLIVSLRHQGVVKVSYPEIELIWILTYPDQLERIQEQYLTPIGEDFKPPVNQHAPMIMPDQDNNPDTIDIVLFDNNVAYLEMPKLETDRQYSRLVQYRINEKDMTVEQIWSYGEERGTDYFCPYVGDADYLENGNVLGCYGQIQVVTSEGNFNTPTILEVNRDTNEVVYEIQLKSKNSESLYRAERLPIYPENWSFSLITHKGEAKARNNYETMQTEVEFVDITL